MKAGSDAAPAGGGSQRHAPGRRRGSARDHYDPREELADGGPLGLPEAWDERLTQKAPRIPGRRQDETVPGKRGPAPK